MRMSSREYKATCVHGKYLTAFHAECIFHSSLQSLKALRSEKGHKVHQRTVQLWLRSVYLVTLPECTGLWMHLEQPQHEVCRPSTMKTEDRARNFPWSKSNIQICTTFKPLLLIPLLTIVRHMKNQSWVLKERSVKFIHKDQEQLSCLLKYLYIIFCSPERVNSDWSWDFRYFIKNPW